MNIYDDRPIENAEDDAFEFRQLAHHIVGQIKEVSGCSGQHSSVISIEGAWGSGKTSLVNLVTDEINRNEAQYVVARFNPWNYESSKDLVEGFISTFRASLTSTDSERVKRKLLKLADDYFESFSPKTTWAKVARFSIKSLRRAPEEAKRALARKMADGGKTILFVIDDIDRLPDDQILAVIRLVASSLNLPHVVYLLAFESGAVENAVSKAYAQGGKSYLEKTAQVRFQMPPQSSAKLWDILFRESSRLAMKYGAPTLERDSADVYYMMEDECDLITTMRAVKSVLRLFHEKLLILGREYRAEEVLALCTIEATDRTLFRWVQSNYYHLLGYKRDDVEMTLPKDKVEHSNATFDSIPNGHDESAVHLLRLLFSPDSNMTHEVVGGHRVRELDWARAYFRKTRSDLPILTEDVEELLDSHSCNQMEEAIRRHLEGGKIQAALRELRKRNSLETDGARANLIEALLVTQGEANSELQSFLGLSDARYIGLMAFDVLKHYNPYGRFDLLRSIMERRTSECLPGMGGLLHRLALAFGDIGDGAKDEEKQLLERGQFDMLRDLFLDHMEDEFRSVILSTDPNSALFVWKTYREESYRRCLTAAFESDSDLLARFAIARLSTAIGENGRSWGYGGNTWGLTDGRALNDAVEESGNSCFACGKMPEKRLVALYLALNGWGQDDPDIGRVVSEGLVDRFLHFTETSSTRS